MAFSSQVIVTKIAFVSLLKCSEKDCGCPQLRLGEARVAEIALPLKLQEHLLRPLSNGIGSSGELSQSAYAAFSICRIHIATTQVLSAGPIISRRRLPDHHQDMARLHGGPGELPPTNGVGRSRP